MLFLIKINSKGREVFDITLRHGHLSPCLDHSTVYPLSLTIFSGLEILHISGWVVLEMSLIFFKQQGVVNYSLFTAKKALLTFLSFLLKLLKIFFCNSFPHMFGYEADAVSWTVSYVELVNVTVYAASGALREVATKNRDALVNVSPPRSSALRNTAKASSSQ